MSEKSVVPKIKKEAKAVEESILKRKKPSLHFPIRSLANVRYLEKEGYFEIRGRKKERTLTVNTVKTFAQTLRMMALSKKLVEHGRHRHQAGGLLRLEELGRGAFPGADGVGHGHGRRRGALRGEPRAARIRPRGEGGRRRRESGRDRQGSQTPGQALRIDCTKFGSGAYSIPISVEHLKFETKAKFILVIETAGMFQRLVKHNYWKTANCILVSMGGVPTRACRRFIRRLADMQKIPVYVFVDGDPYGISNIYRTFKVGSGNAAHINEFFCVPQARFLGITPQDILDYKLPTHPLKEVDVKRAKDAVEKRSLLPPPQGVGEGDRASRLDGGPRRAAGAWRRTA